MATQTNISIRFWRQVEPRYPPGRALSRETAPRELSSCPCPRAPLPPSPRVCRPRPPPTGVAPSVQGNSNSHGARPVHLIITMITWIRTSRLSILRVVSLLATPGPESLSPEAAQGSCAIFFREREFFTDNLLARIHFGPGPNPLYLLVRIHFIYWSESTLSS